MLLHKKIYKYIENISEMTLIPLYIFDCDSVTPKFNETANLLKQ